MSYFVPHVQLQSDVVDWLFRILPKEEEFVRELVTTFRKTKKEYRRIVLKSWEERINQAGFFLPHDERWDVVEAFYDIILEQVDDTGGKLKVRNILGFPLFGYGKSFTPREYAERRGTGENFLRTTRFAQSRALKVGDVLATGERIISTPREGGNGSVLVHLSSHQPQGLWFSFPARTALALRTPRLRRTSRLRGK